MKNIIYIGGSPCAGKSTLSEYLGNKLGYKVIRLDDYMDEHVKEADENQQPVMYKWKTRPWHELFSRPVDLQVEEEIEFYHEQWPFLIERLKCEVNEKMIIEGCALLPAFVGDLHGHVFYMVPSEDFQREKYAERTWAFGLLKDADDPKDAFNKWMERDINFASYVKRQAEEYDYKVYVIDGNKSVEEIGRLITEELQVKS